MAEPKRPLPQDFVPRLKALLSELEGKESLTPRASSAVETGAGTAARTPAGTAAGTPEGSVVGPKELIELKVRSDEPLWYIAYRTDED